MSSTQKKIRVLSVVSKEQRSPYLNQSSQYAYQIPELNSKFKNIRSTSQYEQGTNVNEKHPISIYNQDPMNQQQNHIPIGRQTNTYSTQQTYQPPSRINPKIQLICTTYNDTNPQPFSYNQQIQQQENKNNNNNNPQNNYYQISAQTNHKQITQKNYQCNNTQTRQENPNITITNKKSQNQIESQIFNTMFLTSSAECIRCKSQIHQKMIQLNCFHQFHEECLHEMVKQQIYQYSDKPFVVCLCNKQISQKLLRNLISKDLFEQLLKKQLQILTSNHKIIQVCNNCGFLYYFQSNWNQICICQKDFLKQKFLNNNNKSKNQ